MLSLFTILLIVGVAVLLFRQVQRSRERHRYMYPPMDMGQQQECMPRSGYDPNYYQRPMYGPTYPQQGYPQQGYQQNRGMNPWMAGGLGALGGAALGYGVGEAMNDQEGLMQNGEFVGPTSESPQGDYAPMDFGGDDGGAGADFGGGDFSNF